MTPFLWKKMHTKYNGRQNTIDELSSHKSLWVPNLGTKNTNSLLIIGHKIVHTHFCVKIWKCKHFKLNENIYLR
jgi:hypothetical protein